ncbi:MAG: secondary thiamine-phosphate synthase enzyme YjbQ [Candidatus Heimdallarchaeota archaeon]
MFEEISISTNQKINIVDITAKVEEQVKKSGVATGICSIITLHSTAAVILQEVEHSLLEDLNMKLEEIFYQSPYRHRNAAAHLATSFLGQSVTLAIRNSLLRRGTWQQILLVELDGPRTRSVAIQIIKDEG